MFINIRVHELFALISHSFDNSLTYSEIYSNSWLYFHCLKWEENLFPWISMTNQNSALFTCIHLLSFGSLKHLIILYKRMRMRYHYFIVFTFNIFFVLSYIHKNFILVMHHSAMLIKPFWMTMRYPNISYNSSLHMVLPVKISETEIRLTVTSYMLLDSHTQKLWQLCPNLLYVLTPGQSPSTVFISYISNLKY